MIFKLLTSPGRAWKWLSTPRRAASQRRTSRPRRQMVVAQGHGGAMVLDCQRHKAWWTGMVRVRDGAHDRVVHVCTELRRSKHEALHDAEHEAQRLALMFAQ